MRIRCVGCGVDCGMDCGGMDCGVERCVDYSVELGLEIYIYPSPPSSVATYFAQELGVVLRINSGLRA